MKDPQGFTQQWRTELYNPDHWDIAGAGYQALEEFLKEFAEQQSKLQKGIALNSAEIEKYRRNYDIYYKAHAKVNARMGQLVANAQLSEADKAVFAYMRQQERSLKLAVDTLRSRNSLSVGEFHLLARKTRFAELAGKSLGGFIGLGQILEAADSQRIDEVGKVSAGVILGLGGGSAASGLAIWAAGFFAVAGAPVTLAMVALAGITVGYAGDKAAQAAWHTWISSDADRRVRDMIKQADDIYQNDPALAERVKQLLRGSADKLGKLDGSWLEGYDNMSNTDKALLSYIFFSLSSNHNRLGGASDQVNRDLGELAFRTDLLTLFDAPWRASQLATRDAMLKVMNTIAGDPRNNYTEPLVLRSEAAISIEVPLSLRQQFYALRDVIESALTFSEATMIGGFSISSLRILLESSSYTGTVDDDLILGSIFNDTLYGEMGTDYLIGGGGSDTLSGGSEYDYLFGGDDADVIEGGEGGDYLLGGKGTDSYLFDGNYGLDTVIDSDGHGVIYIDNLEITGGIEAGEEYWISADKRFGFSSDVDVNGSVNLVITQGSSLNRITIRDWHSGDLGIILSNGPGVPPQESNTILGGRQYIPELDPREVTDELGNLIVYVPNPEANDVLNGSQIRKDVIFGGNGNDMLAGHGGKDIVDGEDGNDALFGGADDDFIAGGGGVDIISGDFAFDTRRFRHSNNPRAEAQVIGEGWYAYIEENKERSLWWNVALLGYATGDDTITADDGDDWVRGDFGNDLIELGLGNDVANGDDGSDTLFGDGGEDILWGDYVFVRGFNGQMYCTSYEGQGSDLIYGGSGRDILYGVGKGDILYGEDGGDIVYGDDVEGKQPGTYHGDDLIDGGAGQDFLYGSGGSDDLYGGDGDDLLAGDNVYEPDAYDPALEFHGDDYLDGEGGDDKLIGDGGNDELYGGTGNDMLQGDAVTIAVPGEFHGRDFIEGGSGNDQLQGDGNNDILLGGDGGDVVYGDSDATRLPGRFHGSDYLDGEDGGDYLEGGGRNDEIHGGNGNDTLIGDSISSTLEIADHGDDTLYGGAGSDYLQGNGGDDILSGGNGDDRLVGDDFGSVFLQASSQGRDSLDGEDGNDYLIGGGSDDHIYGGNGNDFLAGDNSIEDVIDYSLHGHDYLDGGDGDDYILGNGGDDILFGGKGDDQLLGDDEARSSGDDLLFGEAGHDRLAGGSGNDTLDGGAGNDELFGGEGHDIYLFGYGSGNDIIYEINNENNNGNTISMPGVAADDIKFDRTWGDALRILLISTGDTLIVTGYFTANGTHSIIEKIVFDDSSAILTEDISARVFGGTRLNDTLIGGNSDDVLNGAAGDDLINGGLGDDFLYGGEGDDDISGNHGSDTLIGGGGFDMLSGGEGDDTYIFSRGDGQIIIHDSGLTTDQDTLVLEGIKSSNVRLVESGSNLIIFIDDSSDIISVVDYFKPADLIEAIRFSDDQVWNSNQVSLSLCRRFIGGKDKDSFFGSSNNDYLDGGAGNDSLYGGLGGKDYLIGGPGNDQLNGGGDDDTYFFLVGDGRDYIFDNNSIVANHIVFGPGIFLESISVSIKSASGSQTPYNASDFPVSGDSLLRDIQIDYAANDSVTLALIYSANGSVIGSYGYAADNLILTFADGMVLSLSELVSRVKTVSLDIIGTASNDLIYDELGDNIIKAGEGNDIIITYYGDNTIYGGPGNDRIYGSIGNNTYTFSLGMGFDKIFEDTALTDNASYVRNKIKVASGITPSDIKLTRPLLAGEWGDTSTDLVVRHKNGTDKLIIYGWDRGVYSTNCIVFEDGTIWDESEIRSRLLSGSNASDEIVGTSSAELIRGGPGHDTLRSGYLNTHGDVLLGEDGDDSFFVYDAGIPHLSGGNGKDQLGGIDWKSKVIIDPGPGDDNGGFLQQWLQGAQPTIYFDRGYGSDSSGLADIVFGPSILPHEIIVSATGLTETHKGNVLQGLSFRVGNSPDILTIKTGVAYKDILLSKETIVFRDGTRWPMASIARYFSLSSSDYTDNIVGSEGPEVISGGLGDDKLYGNLGDDILNGDAGNDSLFGNQGDDVIDGGPGDDVVDGGDGNDTYLFRDGSGQDYYSYEYSLPAKGYTVDTIQIEALPHEVSLRYIEGTSRHGSLSIRLNGTTDEFVVYNWFIGSPSSRNLQLRFSDGTLWNHVLIANNTPSLINTNSSYITGTYLADRFESNWLSQTIDAVDGDDYIEGGGGNDDLYGRSGNDYLDGGAGNDWLYGGTGDDTYIFGYGYGQDTILEILGGDDSSLDYGSDIIMFTPEVRPQDVLFDFDLAERSYVFRLAGTKDKLTLYNTRDYAEERIEKAIFQDGTVWNLLINPKGPIKGSDANDSITGTRYDDTINGGMGADIIDGGFGDDILSGEDGADVIKGGRGNNTIDGGEGNDRITGGDDDIIIGGAGDDIIESGIGYSSITPGLGNDTVYVGDSDNYYFKKGDGQDVILRSGDGGSFNLIFDSGILPSDIILSRTSTYGKFLDHQITLSVLGTTDSIRISDVDYTDSSATSQFRIRVVLRFADGVLWAWGDVLRKLNFVGTSNSDILTSPPEGQELWGMGGNDGLFGGGGNDILRGGDGMDELWGSGGDDLLDGGLDGPSTLGLRSDLLFGAQGSDTYYFDRGYGWDVIDEYLGSPPSNSEKNSLVFGSTIRPQDIAFTRDTVNDESRSTSDIHLQILNSSDKLTIKHFFGEFSRPNGIHRIVFADGTVWERTDIINHYWRNAAFSGQVKGSNVFFALEGTDGSNDFRALDGPDKLYGFGGDDTLDGNGGDDEIFGGSGNDILDDASGDDILCGDSGDDIYVFGRGYGRDLVVDFDRHNGNDRIKIVGNICPSDIAVERDDINLYLGIKNTGDRLAIRWFPHPNYQIESVEFEACDQIWGSDTLELIANDVPFQAPELLHLIQPQLAYEDASFSFVVPSGTFGDADANDTLSLAAQLADGSPLPSWLLFDSETGTLQGIPANSDVGTIEICIKATDKRGLFVSTSFALTIVNANDIPTLSGFIGDQTVPALRSISLVIPRNTFSDVDSEDVLTYRASLSDGSPLPEWLHFNSRTQEFRGVSPEKVIIDLTVTATDMAGSSASLEFKVNVIESDRDTPQSQPGLGISEGYVGFLGGDTAVFAIGGTVAVGQTLSAQLLANDPDGNGTFAYQWQTSSDGTTWLTVGSEETYTVASADQGKQLRLAVAYTDAQNFGEVVTVSGGTVPIPPPPDIDLRVVALDTVTITNSPVGDLEAIATLNQINPARSLTAIGIDHSSITLGTPSDGAGTTVRIQAAVTSIGAPATAFGVDRSRLLLRPGDDTVTISAQISGVAGTPSVALRNSFLSANRGDDQITLQGDLWGERALIYAGDGNDRITAYGIGRDSFLQAGPGDDWVSLGHLETTPGAAPLDRVGNDPIAVSTYRGGAGFDTLNLREVSQAEFNAEATWFTSPGENGWQFRGARFSGFENYTFG